MCRKEHLVIGNSASKISLILFCFYRWNKIEPVPQQSNRVSLWLSVYSKGSPVPVDVLVFFEITVYGHNGLIFGSTFEKGKAWVTEL